MVREITEGDLKGIFELYTQLHGNPIPEDTAELSALCRKILRDENHHIIVAEEGGKIVSSCVCVIVPNLTHGQRPYALVENVVTDEAFRRRGLATACLDFAREISRKKTATK